MCRPVASPRVCARGRTRAGRARQIRKNVNVEHRFDTSIDGQELTLGYTDTGHGAAVVFLHALGRSSEDWQTTIADLSTSFRCIAVDLPGHGHSSRARRYSFDLLARSTHQLIDHLGLESFAIVAHSLGGTTAWVLAPELGQRLWALVVEDTGVPSGRIQYPDVPADPPEGVVYDWEARRQIVDELNRPDPRWRERLVEVATPVLVLAGRAHDVDIDATIALLPHAEVVTIPAGHWIHQDAPQRFVAATRTFLARSQPGG